MIRKFSKLAFFIGIFGASLIGCEKQEIQMDSDTFVETNVKNEKVASSSKYSGLSDSEYLEGATEVFQLESKDQLEDKLTYAARPALKEQYASIVVIQDDISHLIGHRVYLFDESENTYALVVNRTTLEFSIVKVTARPTSLSAYYSYNYEYLAEVTNFSSGSVAYEASKMFDTTFWQCGNYANSSSSFTDYSVKVNIPDNITANTSTTIIFEVFNIFGDGPITSFWLANTDDWQTNIYFNVLTKGEHYENSPWDSCFNEYTAVVENSGFENYHYENVVYEAEVNLPPGNYTLNLGYQGSYATNQYWGDAVEIHFVVE